MDFKLQEGEKIIKEGWANISTVLNAKAGKLYLTNQRLLFIGHGINIGNDAYTVNLSDIMYVKKSATVSFWALFIPIPNAIVVATNSGNVTKFTVRGRKKWVKEISSAINN